VPKPPRRSASRPPAGGRAQATAGAGSRPVRPKRLARPPVRESFVQRNRVRLLWAGALVAVVAIGAVFYLQATAPAYACGIEWTAPATPSPAPGATPRIGYVQEDMGRNHVNPGTDVKYLYCPPASGSHINATGQGPIEPRLYGPNDRAIPEGWIHNLEHGGLVVLYRCPGDACSDAGQAALQQLWASWPASPVCNVPPHAISPVIARFDDMAYPYVAIVWDQVLPLQTLDTAQILAFYAQQAERTNPEPQCAAPTASPSAAPPESAAPSGS
jgi:hypothetical protein